MQPKPIPKETPPPLEFSFKIKQAPLPGMSGGLYSLCLNKRVICDYVHWGFRCCGVALLQHFSQYFYDVSGFEKDLNTFQLLEKYHEQLFQWLKTNSPDTWKPQEFMMVITNSQATNLRKMLNNPCVKCIDTWMNKSHGPSRLYYYRISLQQDFTK